MKKFLLVGCLLVWGLGIASSGAYDASAPEQKYPDNCKVYFDGCNKCSRASVGAEMACPAMWCSNPGKAECREYFTSDGIDCPANYAPVCGQVSLSKCSIGAEKKEICSETLISKTYSNSCMAGKANAKVLYNGECKTDSSSSSSGGGAECPANYAPVCAEPPMSPCPEGMACAQVMPQPKTYSNSCVAKNAKATILYSGECKKTGSSSGGLDCSTNFAPVCAQPPMPKCPDGTLCKIQIPQPKTYTNSCVAGKANAKVLYSGECKKTGSGSGSTDCPSILDPVCAQVTDPDCPVSSDGGGCSDVTKIYTQTFKNHCLAQKANARIISIGVCKSEDSSTGSSVGGGCAGPEDTDCQIPGPTQGPTGEGVVGGSEGMLHPGEDPEIYGVEIECKMDAKVCPDGTSVGRSGPSCEFDCSKHQSQKGCTKEYMPVCGVDGKTYSNTCMAGDTEIKYTGKCLSKDFEAKITTLLNQALDKKLSSLSDPGAKATIVENVMTKSQKIASGASGSKAGLYNYVVFVLQEYLQTKIYAVYLDTILPKLTDGQTVLNTEWIAYNHVRVDLLPDESDADASIEIKMFVEDKVLKYKTE